MQKFLNAIIFEEDGWHIAQCIEIDVASQGNNEEEAFTNLREAIALHLLPPSSNILGEFASSLNEAQSLVPGSTVKKWCLQDG